MRVKRSVRWLHERIGRLSRREAAQVFDSVAECPRCGASHILAFRPFARPVNHGGVRWFTHWALCPATGEPILARPLSRGLTLTATITRDPGGTR